MHGVTSNRQHVKGDEAVPRSEAQADSAGLRQTIARYHPSVMGILIAKSEDRVRRIERHLDLPACTSG